MATFVAEGSSAKNLPIKELISRAIGDVREMAKVEIGLAKKELGNQALELKVAGILFATAFTLLVLALAMALVALVLALGAEPLTAGLVGLGLLLGAGIAAFIGWKALPKRPMARTRKRIEHGAEEIKENVGDLKDAVAR